MKNKKKGFTLVELIVVLAILAILAAMLVPALTGYIDKANEKKAIATARQYAIAAQSTVSDAYASNIKITAITITASGTTSTATCTGDTSTGTKFTTQFTNFAEIKGGDTATLNFGDDQKLDNNSSVTTGGVTVYYKDGVWAKS